jgi:hypothetical protein
MRILDPKAVQEAVDRMNGGEASEEVLGVLIKAAEAYARMTPEWGFVAPIEAAGMHYVTRNQMLAETMQAGRPEAHALFRVAPDWIDTADTGKEQA